MRAPALAPMLRAILPVVALALAPVGAWAEQPPAAASAKKQPTPVVQPQGQTHAQKPAAALAKPEPPVVPAAAPVMPPPVMPPPVAPPPGAKPPEDGKPADAPKLPRFQSLRSNDVNLRAGPGTRYRIDWVYKRADLPVEVQREFEHWRLVRDADGIQGWVNQATLTARRNFIVKGADAKLMDDPKDTAAPVAVLRPGVIGRIKSCRKDSTWCHVQVAGHGGYLRRAQFWGTLPDEEIAP